MELNKRVCVIIPVYNESKSIGTLVEHLQAKELVVLVVDDGSTDGSALIAERFGAMVLRMEHRRGKGSALTAGFRWALDQSFQAVLTMDGDGQHAVADVELFLRAAETCGPCVITGNRLARGSRQMPKIRLWTNRFMSAIISMAIRCRVPDTQCGFRYISADVLKNISITTRAFEIETEVLMKAAKGGYPIISVPVACIYDRGVSRIRPVRDAMKFFYFYCKQIFRRD
jgi:glycosyltransferase involved in cell wall biosynthesis